MIADESGGITVLMLVLLLGIVLCVGFSIDLMNQETRRASLQGALDRGVLAVTSVRADAPAEDARAIIEAYVGQRPFADGSDVFVDGDGLTKEERAGVAYSWLSIDAQLDNPIERRVRAAAAVDMQTTFLHIAGLTGLPVPANSAAIERVKRVEIALLLDISGTMRWTNSTKSPAEGESRMEKLKPAAKAFIDAVTNNGLAPGVTVTLVPYAGSVNVGRIPFSILTGRTGIGELIDDDLSGLTLGELGVGHRSLSSVMGGSDAADAVIAEMPAGGGDPPATADITLGAIRAAGFDVYDLDWSDVDGDAVDMPHGLKHPFSYCVDLESGSDTDFRDLKDFYMPAPARGLGQVEHFNYFGYDRYAHGNQIMEWGWCPSNESSVVWLSDDHTAVKDTIDSLLMNDGTSTYTAMKWAVASLDPANRWFVDEMIANGQIDARFRSTGDEARPAALDDDRTLKIVVLMTDGNVNYDYRVDEPDTYSRWWHDGRPTGGSNSVTRTEKNKGRSLFLDLCSKARTEIDSLRIYTIAFDTNSTSIDNEMRQCAGDEGEFFQADLDTIKRTFETIATEIQELKLVQ